MLFIFEGPDGSGKSTLIGKLTARLVELGRSPVVRHHGAYIGEGLIAHHYFDSVYEALNGGCVVMDRSWLAEPIYSRAMRGGSQRLPWEWEAFEHLAGQAGAVVVVCLPPFEACRAAWESRRASEYPDDEAKLRAVYDGYARSIAKWSREYPTVLYDRTVDPLAEVTIASALRLSEFVAAPAEGAK